MFRTLYAKLAAVLILLLTGIGLLYALISLSATRHYLQEVSQHLNRDLARNLVADRNLVEEGRINEAALRETFHEYMVINPSIEIYLLDRDGTILSYSADPGKVKRRHVSLAPILAFLRGEQDYPLLGDDPRSHDRRKAFSVTPVPSARDPRGYLYVVLRGEEYDTVDALIREGLFLRLSGGALSVSLVFGLLVGLLVFHVITRRLRRLATIIDAFHRSNFVSTARYGLAELRRADEVDRLGATFDLMASRIGSQLHALKEQDALRRDLVARVSHDLRTPLASLTGYLESLQLRDAALSAEERARYLSISLRQSKRLGRMVAELFELARLDARETLPRCEPFAAAELVQDVIQKFRLRAGQQRVRIEMQLAPELAFVSADIALTERVLENLIDNALTHTPAGGQVRVSLRRQGRSLLVGVADTGPGIPGADLAHLFEPYYQSAGTRRGHSHAGLGLAIARRIVELQRGRIRVVSEPGKGTIFAFSLPIAAAPA